MSSNILKGKLVEKNVTYKDCATALDVSITTFTKKINNPSSFSIEEANKLANYLKLSKEERINIFLA